MKKEELKTRHVPPLLSGSDARGNVGMEGTRALRVGRWMAQNARMKVAMYMVGALAVIVICSITWSTMLMSAH